MFKKLLIIINIHLNRKMEYLTDTPAIPNFKNWDDTDFEKLRNKNQFILNYYDLIKTPIGNYPVPLVSNTQLKQASQKNLFYESI